VKQPVSAAGSGSLVRRAAPRRFELLVARRVASSQCTAVQCKMLLTRVCCAGASSFVWVGAVKGNASVSPSTGWGWIDLTPPDNLNCGGGGDGCGAWGAGKPSNPGGEGTHAIGGLLFRGLSDTSPDTAHGFVCELDAECPPGYFCPNGTDALVPCAAGRYNPAPNLHTNCTAVCASPPGFGCSGGARSPVGTLCEPGSFGVGGELPCQVCVRTRALCHGVLCVVCCVLRSSLSSLC
jgi:hypothetical protein